MWQRLQDLARISLQLHISPSLTLTVVFTKLNYFLFLEIIICCLLALGLWVSVPSALNAILRLVPQTPVPPSVDPSRQFGHHFLQEAFPEAFVWVRDLP